MTDLELAQLVLSKTPADWRAIVDVAVILAESGGNPDAINRVDYDESKPSYRSMDLGLLQFNTFWNPDMTPWEMFDPETAWNRAYDVITAHGGWGHDWTLWNAYKSGAYQKYLGRAREAVNEALAQFGQDPL